MTSGFMVYIHEDDVIKGVICSHYIDNAWYGHLSDHDISVEFDIITQPAMRYLAFAISSDNVSWEVLHVHDTQSGSATVDVTIPDTYDGTVKLGCKVYDTPPTVGSVLNVGFDYVITGVIELALIGSRTVTLVHEDADAKMVYTIDGTDPTLESIEYAGPFTLDQTSTVKARAYKEGMITSQVSVLEVEVELVELPVVSAYHQEQSTITRNLYTTFHNDMWTEAMLYVHAPRTETPDRYVSISMGVTNSISVLIYPPDVVRVYRMDNEKRIEAYDFDCSWASETPVEYVGVLTPSIQLATPTITDENGLVTITNRFPAEVEHTYYRIDDGDWQEYTEPFQMTASGTVKAYCTGTGYENSEETNKLIWVPLSVGDVVVVDGIETLVLAVKDDSGAWVSTAGAQGTECIGVDKNHDLSYYISGDDYVNQKLPIDSAKYGYEWGGIGSWNSGCQSDLVGTGIVNTDNAISYDFSSETEGWPVLWEKLSEFRQSHSDKWFVPSKDELNLIYENRASLSNLSTRPNEFSVNQGVTTITIYSAYWSSTESDVNYAKTRNMGSNVADSEAPKDSHNPHVRLCVQFDSSDAEIIDDGEIDMIKKNV